MSEDKKLNKKTDELEVTQETDNELDLEELDDVAGGIDHTEVVTAPKPRPFPKMPEYDDYN